MAYEELDTDFAVGDPVRASWMNQIGANSADHEERIGDVETSASDHESRIDLLEANGPSTGRIYTATVMLSDQQVRELPTIPQSLIAATGAGYTVEPLWARIVADTSGGGYGNINAAGVLKVEHSGASWPALAVVPNDAAITNGSATRLTDLLGSSTRRRAILLPQQDAEAVDTWGFVPTIFDLSEAENKALQIRIDNGGSGNLTGGHSFVNGMRIDVRYVLVESIGVGMPFLHSGDVPRGGARSRSRRWRPLNSSGSSPSTLIP